MSWAHAEVPVVRDPATWVAALLEERRGYVLRGLTDRVAQVDAEIASCGLVVVDAPAADDAVADEAPVEDAAAEPDQELETATVRRGAARSRKD